MVATIPSTVRKAKSARQAYEAPDDLELVAAILDAGARARTLADAFAAVGLAAVLMDGAGRVLHVGAAAQHLLGDRLRIESNHLVGHDAEGNAAIETVLNGILSGDGPQGSESPLVPLGAGSSLVLTAVGYADPSPAQLLRAILLIGTDEETLRTRLSALDL